MRNSDPLALDPESDDAALMELSRIGRKEAFACLVRRHQRALLNFFARMGAYSDREDLAQDTFIRLFNYRDRYRPAAKFTTFLYTIARHVWLDRIRKTKRQEAKKERMQSDCAANAGAGGAGLPARMDLQEALVCLPEKLRSVVVLAYWQGLRYDEIAAVLGIPPGTVKSRMFLALNRLKEIFDREKPTRQ